MNQPGSLGGGEHLGRLPAVHRERLLADTVLARGEHRLRLLGVEAVRRGDVNDVDSVVVEHRLEARIRLREARGERLLGRALGG